MTAAFVFCSENKQVSYFTRYKKEIMSDES